MSLHIWLLALAAVVCLPAAPALGQRVTGPYEGLFGAGPIRDDAPQSLVVRGALFGGWDDSLVKEGFNTAGNEDFLATGTGPGVQGGLEYRRRDDTVSFFADGNSEVRWYPKSDNFVAATHSAGTGLEWKVGSNTTTRVNGSATYSSFFQFAPFLDATTGGASPLTPGFGFAAAAEPNTRLAAGAGAVIAISRRSTLSADAEWSDWRFLDRPESTVETLGGRGTLVYRITRALGLRGGFAYQEGRYSLPGDESVPIRTIEAGIDYRDTLEFARRTALTFGTSTSAVEIEGDTHYRVEGSAVLSRGFRRTWSTALAFARTTSFMPGFSQPILSDSVNADVGGLVSRRVKWSTGAGYSRNSVGFESSGTFATYSGGSRIEYALNDRFGLFGQYVYYRYRDPGNVAGGSVPQFARQTATAGLKLWAPIIGR